MTAADIYKELETYSTPEKKEFLPYFFKTGKGQYGEGDKFIGVIVPDTRKVARKYKDISYNEITKLLDNEYHECRLCALLMLVERFKKTKGDARKEIFDFYLSKTTRINNWDLVDLSAKDIVGEYLIDKDRSILYRLAESTLLWDQRIAILSTFAFIKKGDLDDIFALSQKLLDHKHDLMHKAIGWMLREAGKKDKDRLCRFLDIYNKKMPRTMLRYSIEKFTPEERAHYMKK
ncbi:DNA alkylation repair protein [Dysgonomonas sp. Marseille-P4677]|uniref:DNA alkylation repair protein n=1 Tax=Dysgonomonas sp. Marseille-P4677 TaxID=2364790 RepID=UPI001913732A|nr:DNA alkylation repair protein [Dysgonomonas sp. Marseille-P4677]MBK5721192.1 DNA alkylation repair protein [Dysgonomonas sp. Marseille-P4677]